MATFTITSRRFPNGEFPPGTSIRIESVTGQYKKKRRDGTVEYRYRERKLFWKSKDVVGPVTLNYDPGKYLWKAHRHTPFQQDNFSEGPHAFLVGMTEEEYEAVSGRTPRHYKGILGTDGTRYHCKWSGCDRVLTSKTSAYLHERREHQGEKVLSDPNQTIDLRDEPTPPPKKRGFTNPKEAPAPS